MENDATVGWIAAIVIGGIAGWLAEQFMKSDTGMLVNIALGIVGAGRLLRGSLGRELFPVATSHHRREWRRQLVVTLLQSVRSPRQTLRPPRRQFIRRGVVDYEQVESMTLRKASSICSPALAVGRYL